MSKYLVRRINTKKNLFNFMYEIEKNFMKEILKWDF